MQNIVGFSKVVENYLQLNVQLLVLDVENRNECCGCFEYSKKYLRVQLGVGKYLYFLYII